MAVTAIKIGDTRLKFMTVYMEPAVSTDGATTKQFLTVDLVTCDEDFIPNSKGSRTIDERDEETYHKALREAAIFEGQFVPEESTDPQWNPNYVESIEEIKNGSTI